MRSIDLDENSLNLAGVRLFKFVKFVFVMVFVLIAVLARSIEAGLAIGVFIFPFWILLEWFYSKSSSANYWMSQEKKRQRSEMPLKKAVEHITKGKENKEINQAIIEGRIKEQVYATLKDRYGFSEEDFRSLDSDPDSLEDKVPNENLRKFLKHAKDLKDLTDGSNQRRPTTVDNEFDTSSSEDEIDFEKRIRLAIDELADIYDIE